MSNALLTEEQGSASPFSILSPQGMTWIQQKTGSHDVENVIAESAKWDWVSQIQSLPYLFCNMRPFATLMFPMPPL